MAESELSIKQHLGFQRVHWALSRYMWIPLLLLLLAALLGFFGGPPLVAASGGRSADGSLQADYHHFARFTAPTDLTLHLKDVSSQTIKVAIDNNYLHAVEVQGLSPQPDSVTTAGDQTVYTFTVQPGNHMATVVFSFWTQQLFSVHGDVKRLDNGQSLTLNQFIYP